LMIISFISAAFRVFRRTNDDVKLQMEAQTAMNQIINIAMEAKSISAKTIITSQEERYLIDNLDLAGYSDYALIYRKDLQKLYLVEMAPSDTLGSIVFDSEEHFDQECLLSEYVSEFNITSVGSDDSVKNIVMKLQLGQDTYDVTKEVNLRNAP